MTASVYVWATSKLVTKLSRDSATGRSWTVGRLGCLRGKTVHHRHAYMGTAQISSATDLHYNLYAPVVCKVLFNAYDHVGQIESLGVQKQVVPGLSGDRMKGALRSAI
eukprot:1349836-Pleurochrysis_carterae.AAC.2